MVVYRNPYRCGRIIHAKNVHAVMMNMNTFKTRISGTQAHSHTPRLKPNISATPDPIVSAIQCFMESSRSFAQVTERSNIMIERVISNVSTPTTNAPVSTDIRQIRYAGLPNGTKWRHTHPRKAHNGYPGGCGTPKLNAPVTSSPESSSVTSG